MSVINLDLKAFFNITELKEKKMELVFYFVEKCPEMSEEMKISHETLVNKLPFLESISVISEEKCLRLRKSTLKGKRFIFIFDDFNEENEAFEYIFNISEVYIFGPQCLMTMIIENVPTPVGLLHLHNLAMRNLVICPTEMTEEKKNRVKQQVELMGGLCVDTMTDQVTHLVGDNVNSMRYQIAAKNGIKVMHVDWIASVWSKCQNTVANILATDAQFESSKLAVFCGLCVASTGFSVEDESMIRKDVEDNGGRYSPSFNFTVQILIMNRESIGSEKFELAQKWGRFCLLPSWITDSLKHGYSLASEPYKLHVPSKPSVMKQIKAATSTMNASVTVSNLNPDNTQLPEISSVPNQVIPAVSLGQANISSQSSVAASSGQNLHGQRSQESVPSEKRVVKDSGLMIERTAKPKVIHDKPSPASPTVNFLMGKYVCIHGFSDSSSRTVILRKCERVGASLVDDTFHREIDYVIMPLRIEPNTHQNIKRFKHIVSNWWLEDCIIAGECLPVEYYHKPLTKLMCNEKPLEGEIYVVTNYNEMEREYIKVLVGILGGVGVDILRQTDNPCLISPNMTGAKCTSAKAWDLAVLPVEWLMECYETKQRVDETNYLLGETKPTARNQKRRELIVPSSQDAQNYGEDERSGAGPSNVTPLQSARENQADNSIPRTNEASKLDVPLEDSESFAEFFALKEKFAQKPRQMRFVQLDEDDSSQSSAPGQDSEVLVQWSYPDDRPAVVRKSPDSHT